MKVDRKRFTVVERMYSRTVFYIIKYALLVLFYSACGSSSSSSTGWSISKENWRSSSGCFFFSAARTVLNSVAISVNGSSVGSSWVSSSTIFGLFFCLKDVKTSFKNSAYFSFSRSSRFLASSTFSRRVSRSKRKLQNAFSSFWS